MKDFTVLRLTGESVESLCEAEPNYRIFVTIERKKVIYVKLKKALYGCVLSALLWYALFSSTLHEIGFELNSYDTCVANKEIDCKQCTITRYVDDLKVSHVKEEVVQDVIDYTEEIICAFSKISKINSGVATPASRNLFSIKEDSPRLDERRSTVFHHCETKLLYVTQRCRLDILLAVSFYADE